MCKLSILTLLIILSLSMLSCASSKDSPRSVYEKKVIEDSNIIAKKIQPKNVLRVATLNIAHGRKDSFSQFLISNEAIKKNLTDIAQVLNQHQAHIVALQEADSSESFNHVKFLATKSQYPWRVQVSNVDMGPISYGTALLSTLPLTDAIKHTFFPSWPTFNKGFVLTQVLWPSEDHNDVRKIDIISVHLDFSRKSVREKQIQEMVDILSKRNNPTIVMGDFNNEWLGSDSAIKKLAVGRFNAYQSDSLAFKTYKNKRLDWILITKDLEFVTHQVLPEILSDHLMVIAEIRFKKRPHSSHPSSTINIE